MNKERVNKEIDNTIKELQELKDVVNRKATIQNFKKQYVKVSAALSDVYYHMQKLIK